MTTQKIDPKVIFASDAPAIDKPPVFSDKTKGWDVARANDGRPQIKEMNKVQQDTDLKILWLNENSVTPYDESIDYPDGAVAIKDGSFKQLSSGSWVEFLDDFADKNEVKRGIANRYDSSLTYNSGERVVLANGDIVKSTTPNNTTNPNIDMTGWVLDDNTVNNIDELLLIQSPKNSKTVFVKSRNGNTLKGGGYFNFVVGSTKNDGGQFFATATGSWHRITVEVWKNIQWWGAVGDGVTDDTQAIKNAVQAMGNIETWNGASNPSDGSFCTLYVPPSSGNYIVSDTIYLPPYLRLKGDSAKGGSLASLYDKNISVIEAKFPLPENYKWVISTVNRVRATGELTTWDSIYGGVTYDQGIVTGCFGTSVEDLVVVNKSPENRVYGGIRMQNAPQCSVERVLVEGFDVCVFSCGSWDARFDVGTKSYKCGVLLYGDMNGARLSGYQHGTRGGVAPMSQQMEVFKTNDPSAGFPFDTSTMKYGVYVSFAYGFSSSSLICEYHDVGVFVSGSVGNISSLYCEVNTTSIAAVSSSLNIGSVAGTSNTYAVALGTSSYVDIKAIVGDHAGTFIQSTSVYNSRLTIPKTVNAPYNQAIHFIGDNNVVYLDATNGKDTNSGLHSLYPVKTMTQALISASNRDNNVWFSGTTAEKRAARTIVILDSSEYQPTSWAFISDIDLTIKPISTSLTPRLRVSNYNYMVKNCNILISGVNVFRSHDDSYQPSQGFFICEGDCSITVNSDEVDLSYHFVSVNPTKKAKVKLSIMGRTGGMGANAKYFYTDSKNVFAEVFVRLNNTMTDINSSANNGVYAPPEAYIVKSVNSVL